MDQQTQTTEKPFDIAEFEAADTAWLDVQNKKGDGPLLVNRKPVRIEIRSPGTPEAVRADHHVKQAAQARMFAAMRGKPVKETVESTSLERSQKLEAITARIENFPVEPADLYGNPKLGYITSQVEAFHNDWANF